MKSIKEPLSPFDLQRVFLASEAPVLRRYFLAYLRSGSRAAPVEPRSYRRRLVAPHGPRHCDLLQLRWAHKRR